MATSNVGEFEFQLSGSGYTVNCYKGNSAHVVIPSTYNTKPVVKIDFRAFKNCEIIASVKIPDTVREIGTEAFMNCKRLQSVAIGNGVTRIGRYAFFKCISVSDITFGNSVTTIDELAFAGCNSLVSVTFPQSVNSIYYNAFGNCQKLASVTLPDARHWGRNGPKLVKGVAIGMVGPRLVNPAGAAAYFKDPGSYLAL